MDVYLLSVLCVLSGRCLCDGLITRPEESYRLWCVLVCDLGISRMRRLKLIKGCKCRIEKIILTLLIIGTVIIRGTRWCSWLRHCATSREVAGSIPDGVTRIFHWLNPSGCIVSLGSTQPLT
jgi:hypothetical protein